MRKVDCIVGLAEIDEADVSWSIQFSGMTEDLAEGKELIGGASTSTETCLVFENGGFHPGEFVKAYNFPGIERRLIPR
jgi:hypothetical protein